MRSRRPLEVEALDWQTEFLPWFRDTWKPGEHVSLIAPTGAGKTTFAAGILNLRRYVLALDAKGEDSTLSALGFPRLASWPGEKSMSQTVSRNDEDRRPSRYIIGGSAKVDKEILSLAATMEGCLRDAFSMGGWTIYADELMLLTDPRMYNFRAQIDRILISARDRGISLVSSFQSPTWVTPQAGKQSTWVAISYTRDTDVVNRLAEIVGRPKPEIRGAVTGLERYSWILVGRNPREPLRVTIPDYLPPVKRDREQ